MCQELGRPLGRCRTGLAALPHGGIADVEGRLVETQRDLRVTLDRDVVEHLASWYGTEAPDVLRYSAKARLVDRVAATLPVISGEIAYAVEHQAAIHLSDVVLRRTPLGSAGHPGRAALTSAAEIMGGTLGWTPERAAEEIAGVEGIYPNQALGAGH